MSARGPTRLISPRTTLISCGSSSRLVRRRKRPLRVMRGSSGRWPYGSSLICSSCPIAIASCTIVRNLSMRNTRPLLPTRGWAKRTGRPVSKRIHNAIAARSGLKTSSAIAASTRSSTCFTRAAGVSRARASTTPPYDHSLASALARRGHTVDLLTSPFPFGPVPAPVGYRRDELFLPVSGRILARNPRSRSRYLVKGLEYLPSVRRLSRRLRELEPDVVHVQWLSLPRLDVRWLRGVAAASPTVFTAHHALPRDDGAAVDARRRVYDLVARVIVHSRRGVDDLEALGVERERIAYIPHAVFESAAGDEPTPPSGSTLLFFGLLRAYKGIDVLLRALVHMPEARLVVAGDPLDPVEPLQDLARELGVDARVEWRLGFLPDDEVAALMRDAAVVVLPYRRTDASGVLATAIGHGRPAVVTDVGSLGETVRDFGLGEVVPPGDERALAEACLRLLDPDRLAAAFEGTRAARKALTWDAAARDHERVYEAIL